MAAERAECACNLKWCADEINAGTVEDKRVYTMPRGLPVTEKTRNVDKIERSNATRGVALRVLRDGAKALKATGRPRFLYWHLHPKSFEWDEK